VIVRCRFLGETLRTKLDWMDEIKEVAVRSGSISKKVN